MKKELPQGFTSRGATMDDIPTAVELFNAREQHYLGIQTFTTNMVETEWKMPRFNPETDIHLVFDTDNKLVGYNEAWINNDPPVHPWVWGRVHPEYEGLGIGTYLLNWAEERAQIALERCPVDARVSYRVGTLSTIETPVPLFNKYGLELIRHSFSMKIDFQVAPPEPVWAGGITVRTATKSAEDIETLTRVDMDAFQDHFGFVHQPFEEELAWFSNWLLNSEKLDDTSLWFMAMDGDQAVGLAICAIRDNEFEKHGHVNTLGVIRSHRKRGIGEALLRHSFAEYFHRGYAGVTLGVDGENLTGALKLYNKVGMHVYRQFDLYEKELRPGKEYSVESL